MLPKDLERYFWDVNPSQIDTEKNADYVIERLLEMGDESSFKYLKETYGLPQMGEVLTRSRKLSPRSANFWAIILRVDPKEVRCLKRQFRRTQESHWI